MNKEQVQKNGFEYTGSYYKWKEKELGTLVKNRELLSITYHFYLRRIMKQRRTGRLLDFGCGLGYFLKRADPYYTIYGIDISRFSIEETMRKVPGAQTYVGGAEVLDEFDDGYFDIITAIDVLEHIEKPSEVIKKFNKKLSKGGVLLMNVPNTMSIGKKWKRDEWFALKDTSHKSIFKPQQWMEILNNNNFIIRDKYYDGLWDSPYFPGIPDAVQHLMFKLPSVLLLPFFRFPEKLGENICIICTRND